MLCVSVRTSYVYDWFLGLSGSSMRNTAPPAGKFTVSDMFAGVLKSSALIAVHFVRTFSVPRQPRLPPSVDEKDSHHNQRGGNDMLGGPSPQC